MEIYLIRHTTPKIGKGICYGQFDVPLAETFQEDARKVCSLLTDKIDIIYSSPLIRCLKLAEFFNPKQAIVEDKRILEMDFGNWEMKEWSKIDQRELKKWMSEFVTEKAPGGECFTEVSERVRSFLDDVINSNKNKSDSIVIITHAGVIRTILCQILEIPLHNAFKIAVDYGSITRIHIDDLTLYKSIGTINHLNCECMEMR